MKRPELISRILIMATIVGAVGVPLYFWSRIHDIKFSDALIANAIWPHAEFDNTERLRKVTRPKADEVFSWKSIQRFWRQLELEKALDKLFENRNEKV